MTTIRGSIDKRLPYDLKHTQGSQLECEISPWGEFSTLPGILAGEECIIEEGEHSVALPLTSPYYSYIDHIYRRYLSQVPEHMRTNDSRHPEQEIGFMRIQEYELHELSDLLLHYSLVAPRANIKKNRELCKLVGIVIAYYRGNVLLVPRGNNPVLPDVHTLVVMESLTPNDFNFPVEYSIGLLPVIERGIQEEAPLLDMNSVTFSGVVGGVPKENKFVTSDLGLVFGCECDSMAHLRKLKKMSGGVLYNGAKHLLQEVIGYHQLNPDGWSLAIIKDFLVRRGLRQALNF